MTDAHTPATNNIPFLGDHKITYESIGVGLLKYYSLIVTYDFGHFGDVSTVMYSGSQQGLFT